ncbi:glycoside hydrolase family 57 protein [Candidatus Woesearchaeota archaeon]|nr:glycoside hydrolase family 57 protein [Candidatus Woesearchaeota archaeon]
MVSVCFYFQVHQPFRLRKYSVFDIGNNSEYFDEYKNREIIKKVANKCYLPTNRLLLELIKKHNGKFKVSFSISGVALDQFEKYAPEVLYSFRELARTGCVEFLNETYYHSLSYLFDKDEFKEQVMMHREKIKDLFGQESKAFRNTELIYNNELANYVQGLGYKTILAEGADHILGWRSPNFVYTPKTAESMKLLLKNYKLSDDVAFRFSNKGWSEHPLTVEKYSRWISSNNGNGYVINLFMDYETFGEHQWEDTGIFKFMERLPEEILRHPDNSFVTVSEAAEKYVPVAEMDIHHFMSWADVERDLSAWLGNQLQNSAASELYKVGRLVKKSGDTGLIDDWRKLTTSDHFYYMCIKWFSDGDVHKYFNPYDTPYEGFITFMNVLNDIVIRVKEFNKKKMAAMGQKGSEAYLHQGEAAFKQEFISEHPSESLINLKIEYDETNPATETVIKK